MTEVVCFDDELAGELMFSKHLGPRFFGFTPGVGYTLFSHPMGNHTREAWSAQANSQIGGTIGDSRNERVCFDLAAASAHDDTTCVRIMTESGIMLRGHWLVSAISSKSLDECYARNLRPETWRWWLSGPEKTSVLRPTRKSTIWSY